jgi:hypothetical protein
MAHLAWVILLSIFLGIGLVYRQVWWLRRRAANHERLTQTERDFVARVAAHMDENERRYGVTGQVRAPTADEIAEVRKKYGVTGHVRVRAVTAEEIAEARKRYGRED